MLLAECSVALFLADRCLLEKPEPLLERGSVRSPGCGPRPFYNDPYHLACRLPIKIVPRLNLVLIGNRLRQGKLQLTRDFRHTNKYSKDFILVLSLFSQERPPPARIALSSWMQLTSAILRSLRTSTTENPRSRTACWNSLAPSPCAKCRSRCSTPWTSNASAASPSKP